MTAPAQLTCDYESLVNDVGFHLFGLRPTASDVITDTVASTNQAADILRAIAKGLQFVYSAYRWSFLRPLVSLTTYPSYSTGTITVDAAGAVTGIGTVFPSYSATALGWLNIPSVGAFAIATRTGDTGLTLTGFTGNDAITTATIYSIGFNTYPLPTGVDSLEGDLSFPQGYSYPAENLRRVSEVVIRQMLARSNVPQRPEVYALTTSTASPTAGSTRFISLYPVPDIEYTLTAVGTLRPTMIDATNKYPLGIEVLAPCITESCLAAAEREIEQKDASHPDAVHNRALIPLLQMAIQRDKEYGSPETLGVDSGSESMSSVGLRDGRSSSIYWSAGGGVTGYI